MARNKLEIVVTVLDQAGRPLQKISAELGQVERAAEKADKRTRGFGSALGGLGKLLGPLAAGLGVAGLTRAAYNWASGASKAEIATRLFRKQLERMGQDADAGTAKLEAVAQRLGVLPQDLAEYSTQLLRQGLTMDEIATLFEGAAASALAAGKSTKEGIDAVTNAVVTQQSIYLNYAGIAENLNQAYKEMAKTLGKSVEALTKEEKARAAVNLVMQATKEEVGDLDQLLGGLPGKQNALNKEWAEFRQELGERLIPAISELVELATAGLRALNDLFNWLDHVFGDKVKLAAEDARDEIRAVKRELGEARSADELIDKMKALSDTLSGPGKEAWKEYVAEAEKSKDSIEDISKAATEAIVKFLAVSSVTQEQTVAKAKDALMTAIERSGLSRELVEYFKKAAERGGDAFAGTLAQVRKELSEQVSRISGGTEVATLQRQRLLNQIELLNHLEGAVIPLRKAEAELVATQEEQARILKVLNGEVDTLRDGLAGNGSSGGGGGGLAGDADEAATSFDRLTQSVLDFIAAQRSARGYGGSQISWGPGLGRGGAIVAQPEPGRGIAGGRPLPNPIPDLPGWDWDAAGREAAANFAGGWADHLRDEGRHAMLAELEEFAAGFAAELEDGTNEAFLRSLVGSRNDASIAAAARDVGDYLNRQIHDAMVRGSRDHGIEAAIRQQIEEAKKKHASDLKLIYNDPRRPASVGFNAQQAADYTKQKAEEARRAFEAAAAASEKLLDNVGDALDGLEKMGDALTKGDAGGWFDALGDILDKVPVVGGVLSESARLFGRVVSWFQWLDPASSLRSLSEAQQQYDALGDRFSLIDQSAFASIEKYQEKAFFGLFSVDRYRTEIDEFALGIAQTLEQGVMGGLRSGMRAFLEGDPEWRDSLHDGIRSAIESAIIDAVIQGAIFEGAMGDLLTQLTKQLAAGDEAGALATIEQINAAMPEVERLIEDTLGAYRDALGLGDGGSSVDSATSSSALRYELPEVSVMTSPAWTKTLERAADTMLTAAETFRDAVAGARSEPSGALGWLLRNAGAL